MKQIVFAILLCLAFIAQDVMGQSVRSFEVRAMQAQAIGGAEGTRGFTSVRGTGSRFVSATDEGYAVYETMAADETHFEVRIDDIQGPHWYSDVVISLRSTTADNSDAVSVAVNTQGRIASFKRQGGSISRSSSVASIDMPGQVRLVYDRGTDEVAIEYRTENGNWITKDTHTLDVGATPIAAVFPRNRGIGPTLDVEAVANIRNIALRNPSATQSFVYDQECIDSADAHRLHDFQESYGTLTLGFLDIGIPADSILIQQNTTLINNAINEVGSAGGGSLCLPQGDYYVQPLDLTANSTASIYISHDNITLWGAGRNDDGQGTGLYTRGKYVVIDNEVVRGDGISLPGSKHSILLRDFELNGQSGYTGEFGWPANPETGDGWDTSHKGINLSGGASTASVSAHLERVAVRSYKGEQIFYGGNSLDTLIVRDIISEDTNASTFNATGNYVLVENSEFGLSRFWVEVGPKQPDDTGIYRNNYFHSSSKDRAFVFAGGDGYIHDYLIENNTFEDCNFGVAYSNQLFQFGGGMAGSIVIRNNSMINCGGILFTNTPLATVNVTRDIIFENNTILTRGGEVFYFLRHTDDILIRYNDVSLVGEQNKITTPFVAWAGPDKGNSIVENNTVTDAAAVIQRSNMDEGAKRPLIRNNTYVNTRFSTININVTQENSLVEPWHEATAVTNETDGVVEIELASEHVPDGLPTTLSNSSDSANDILLAASNATYDVDEDIHLAPGESIEIQYDDTLGYWVVL